MNDNELTAATGLAAVEDLPGDAQPASRLPPHLVPLAGGEWAVWRTFALRGAGFPATQVLKLSASECAVAADEVVSAEEELRRIAAEALQALSRARSDADGAMLDRLDKSSKKIKRGLPPELPEGVEQRQTLTERWQAANARAEAARAEFQRAFKVGVDKISQAIREVVSDRQFHEAVVWQNRRVWRSAVEPLLRQKQSDDANTRDSKSRQHEEVVASYVQRYCVKNDTIGFFGPVGWGDFAPQGAGLVVKPGQSLVSKRNIYFESWGIDALAASLANDKALNPWLAPRRMPFNSVRDGELYLPGNGSLKLSEGEAAVVEACDGERTARELALELTQVPSHGLKSESEVYRILESLNARGIIAWTLEIPVDRHGEQKLRRLIERIEDKPLRESALAALTELETAREAVAAAAGDAERLDAALDELEAKFSRLTGTAATRNAGQTYGARSLIYEDCRRDVEVTVGAQVLQALEQPLALLLQSARWVTFEVAARYRKTFANIYAELVKKGGSKEVGATDFWMKADQFLYKDRTRVADTVVPDFQKKWADVLALPQGEKQVVYSCEELRARVGRAFAAPNPGWSTARNHSPDIMIAATSPEAIERGDYQLVMGEIHVGFNNINSSVFVPQHPRPEEIHEAVEADFPETRLVPVLPRYWPEMSGRISFDYVSPKNYRLLVTHDACGIPKSQALPIGSLVVAETADGLIVRDRANRVQFDIVEAFAESLSSHVINTFSLLPPGRHTPRVTIDRLVVCRESWRFTPAEFEFAYEKDEAARFLAARRWMREHELPRFMFVKTKVERKPFYLDLDSPVYVNIFAKAIRRARESSSHAKSPITLTEMIPDHGQAWLPDAEGRRYTSELRIVAVDLTHRHTQGARR
ncbi:MAG TPA: lantibiotic dehydratase [Pyrinomonadaceae bacterium]|nr:lantibiotic dehydratase [Pyrinomonadaceae bacterium]